jgi:hypothetical protein
MVEMMKLFLGLMNGVFNGTYPTKFEEPDEEVLEGEELIPGCEAMPDNLKRLYSFLVQKLKELLASCHKHRDWLCMIEKDQLTEEDNIKIRKHGLEHLLFETVYEMFWYEVCRQFPQCLDFKYIALRQGWQLVGSYMPAPVEGGISVKAINKNYEA